MSLVPHLMPVGKCVPLLHPFHGLEDKAPLPPTWGCWRWGWSCGLLRLGLAVSRSLT